ncbi:hypothetical protein JW935_27075 [candidate division KSB1 bacterium]|nr:hypothetical protein [candidate division KSB1 bacterium]
MPEKKPTAADISMASTKKEMLQAYQDLVKHLEEKRVAEQKPEEKLTERKQQNAIKQANELFTAGVTKSIGELKSEVNGLLASLSDKLDAELQRYDQIKQAVAIRQQELEEIYEIQKQASSLSALIEAQRLRRESFETEMQEKKAALDTEISATRQIWQDEKKKHDEEIRERDARETKDRERQKEEYQYKFNREKELARDAFEDEKAKQERELALKREQSEKELTERESVVVEREKSIKDLENRIQVLETEKKSAFDAAVKETTERLATEAKVREELVKQEFTGEKNVLNTRIQSLEQTVKEQRGQLDSLSKQLDKSMEKVQEIAVRAIEGSSHSRIVNELQQLLQENKRSMTAGKVEVEKK